MRNDEMNMQPRRAKSNATRTERLTTTLAALAIAGSLGITTMAQATGQTTGQAQGRAGGAGTQTGRGGQAQTPVRDPQAQTAQGQPAQTPTQNTAVISGTVTVEGGGPLRRARVSVTAPELR